MFPRLGLRARFVGSNYQYAPSMTVAPESIVAMRASCPGESTKLTALTNSAFGTAVGACGV